MKMDMKINLGQVDFDLLSTDADYDRVVSRILPNAMVQLGEATAEVAWNELQKGLKKSGLKLNNSTSEKRKFIQDGGRNFKRTATAQDKRKLKEQIVLQLREQKALGSM